MCPPRLCNQARRALRAFAAVYARVRLISASTYEERCALLRRHTHVSASSLPSLVESSTHCCWHTHVSASALPSCAESAAHVGGRHTHVQPRLCQNVRRALSASSPHLRHNTRRALRAPVMSLISENPRSRFMLESMLLLWSRCYYDFEFRNRCSISTSSPV